MPQTTQTSNWSSFPDAFMQKQHLYLALCLEAWDFICLQLGSGKKSYKSS